MDSRNIAHEVFEDNDPLTEFYRSIPANVQNYRICNMPRRIIRDIVVGLDYTFSFDAQWEEFAEDMGIHNHMTIKDIKATAKAEKELPLYVAMTGHLHENGTLGQIIHALIQNNRLDVLLAVKPFVEKCVKEESARTKVGLPNSKQSISVHRKETKLNYKTDDKKQTCFNICSSEKLPNEEDLNKTLNADLFFNKNYFTSLCENKIRELKNENGGRTGIHYIVCSCATSGLKDSRQNDVQYSLSDQNPAISIFILNAETDYHIAQRLSQLLQRHHNMRVTVLSDMEHLLFVDDSGVLDTRLRQTNYTVPIISESLLRIIHAPRNFDQQTDDACNVRYVFRWEQAQYKNSGSLNFRVRPVMVPGLNRQCAKQEILFHGAIQLWDEIPKFVRLLQSPIVRRF